MKKKINWIKIIPLTLFLLLVVLAFSALQRENRTVIPSVYIGKQAPPLDLATLGSFPQVTEEDLRTNKKDQITLINFWSSWCPPCRVEHPQLEKISSINGVMIIGVNYKDKDVSALEFLEKYGNPFSKLGTDSSGRNALEWGVYGVPETFVLNQEGNIVYRHPGPITKEIYEKTIKNLLN